MFDLVFAMAFLAWVGLLLADVGLSVRVLRMFRRVAPDMWHAVGSPTLWRQLSPFRLSPSAREIGAALHSASLTDAQLRRYLSLQRIIGVAYGISFFAVLGVMFLAARQ